MDVKMPGSGPTPNIMLVFKGHDAIKDKQIRVGYGASWGQAGMRP